MYYLRKLCRNFLLQFSYRPYNEHQQRYFELTVADLTLDLCGKEKKEKKRTKKKKTRRKRDKYSAKFKNSQGIIIKNNTVFFR